MLTQDQINRAISDIAMAVMANDFMRANAIMTQIRVHFPNVRVPIASLEVGEDSGRIKISKDGKITRSSPLYIGDDMELYNINLSCFHDHRFIAAYDAAVSSGHHFSEVMGVNGPDLNCRFRVHTICWAARHASKLDGDFVECGVAAGFYSLAACSYVEFGTLSKTFWLFDTFNGHPRDKIDDREKHLFTEAVWRAYPDTYEQVKRSFSHYKNVQPVRGTVPEVLSTVNIEKVCYLSLDMNIWKPELAALEYFWDRLVPGAVVVFDDYAQAAFAALNEHENHFAQRQGVQILTSPTGQGILIKP